MTVPNHALPNVHTKVIDAIVMAFMGLLVGPNPFAFSRDGTRDRADGYAAILGQGADDATGYHPHAIPLEPAPQPARRYRLAEEP